MKGFTLIEIIVSVAIFSIAMVIALGALLTMSASDRKAESLKSVINNLNFAVDSMSRSVRVGSNYHCGSSTGGDCASGSNYFAFTAAGSNKFVEYRLGTTQCANGQGCIQRQITPPGGGFLDITSPEVVITDFSTKSPASYLFYLVGSDTGVSSGGTDTVQPKLVITLSGVVQVSNTASSTLHLQTTITQRIYDL